MHVVEQLIERILWSSRLVIIVAVIASILLAFGTIIMATIDAATILGSVGQYFNTTLGPIQRDEVRSAVITGVVKTIDGYLIGAIMLIFGLGLYELFVNKIDVAQRSQSAARLLQINSLDDLKDRLAKMVLLILIIEFFNYAVRLSFSSALDLLYLAAGILLIGGAIYLTKDKSNATSGPKLPVQNRARRSQNSDPAIPTSSDGTGKVSFRTSSRRDQDML